MFANEAEQKCGLLGNISTQLLERPHLLTLRPLEVHVAVTLPALGWRAQFTQSVRLRSFGQADVPEWPGWDHNLRLDTVNI